MVRAMNGAEWRQVPIGLDAEQWITRAGCKTVLVVAHTVTTGQRLIDAVRLVEPDRRVQVLFTAAPDVFSNGVSDLLRDLGGVVLPWEQAIRNRFDLALAAGYGSVHELHAPLIVMPHGAGYNKLAVRRQGGAAVASRGVYGLDPQSIARGGSVVPSAIVLSHRDDLAVLGRQCPEAVPVAKVIGDPCYDRIIASLPQRAAYRRALGAEEKQKVVLFTSTWGSRSLFGQAVELLDRMQSELPADRFKIAALVHPNVWFGHGPRQVRAWLAESIRRGLILISPSADWVGALVAADLIVGDHGSLAVYGSVTAVPIVLAQFPNDDVAPRSASARLATSALRISGDRPLVEQLAEAEVSQQTVASGLIASRITSEPGRFNRNMRRLIYRMLRLSQPPTVPLACPAEVPVLVDAHCKAGD